MSPLPKLGILAGGGALPARLAAACKGTGRPFHIVAFEGHADALDDSLAPDWVRLGAVGTLFEKLKAAQVAEVVLAGRIRRPSLKELAPDWRGAKFLAKVGLAMGDDGLLRAAINEIEAEGFKVIGVEDVLADLLAREGAYGRHKPNDEAWADIRRGVAVAQGLGRLDVGQAVVVQQGLVLGVEAVEGTDALLARVAGLKREGQGGALVKLAKPQQERRADLPTIGPVTVQAARHAGLIGIAVEAGRALVIDADQVIRLADEAGLFVIGIRVEGG
ncbi:MAG: UDP-2,3-diacylglucosamine diphosphatase LpxI [Rhodospirillales bacterium]|nr:UDP-2,3-diacylglucosamine diphosphatase LpxI [Rhodospirillales bacterium]